MPAGLRPADSLNQLRVPLGIPDDSIRSESALVVIQALQLIPIVGLRMEAALAHTAWNARFSIAAIAAVSWTTSAIAVQLLMLILPARWNSLFGRDGLVNPFGWPVLGMTALVAYGQASGIGVSLQATALIADS